MSTTHPRTAPTGFVHHTCVYASDEAFLAMAVPFVEDGLARGEPVLAATTTANLDLLSRALGPRGGLVDYAETAYFGRRPPQRVAAFFRYWQRQAAAANGGQVRILAEPVWAGRSDRDVRAWTRMESGLNAVLASTNIWMICPYDARVVPAEIVADSERTHPARMDGRESTACPEYADPAAFASLVDTAPLPGPPSGAVVGELRGDLCRVRHLVATQAAGYGLTGERLRLLLLAVNETAGYLAGQAPRTPGRIRTWVQAGRVVVDLRQPGTVNADPWVGFRPPLLAPHDPAGLWLARQVCDQVEVRADEEGITVRLEVLGPRAEELIQSRGTRLV